jgi:hypothetical protein
MQQAASNLQRHLQLMDKNITFKHSGHSGDIIYSLAMVQRAYEVYGKKAIYYIKLDVKTDVKGHSMGATMVNKNTFEFLKPLLMQQPYIEDVLPYEGQQVDYDLDVFRTQHINLSANSIALWNAYSYPDIYPDISKKWLHVPETCVKCLTPIVARSLRYTNPFISYAVIGDAYFIGMEEEYKFSKQQLNCKFEHLKVDTALGMAIFINNCPLFLGNQSMPFAIAEGLKVDRILEHYQACPNVIPVGGNAKIFHTQEQLIKII